MSESDICPKCGAEGVTIDANIADTLEESLTAQVHTKPGAMFFKGTVSVPLKALVCGACGFAELYATNPSKLLEAHDLAE